MEFSIFIHQQHYLLDLVWEYTETRSLFHGIFDTEEPQKDDKTDF